MRSRKMETEFDTQLSYGEHQSFPTKPQCPSLTSSLFSQQNCYHPSHCRKVKWELLRMNFVMPYMGKDQAKAGAMCMRKCCVQGASPQESPSAGWVRLSCVFPMPVLFISVPLGVAVLSCSLCGDPHTSCFITSTCFPWVHASIVSLRIAIPLANPNIKFCCIFYTFYLGITKIQICNF